ncbi:MAG: nitroreductase family protein [Bacteroidota bacterium]|nr:nitroreductase family protein [Bacteroidota bacterium]
MKHLSLVGLFTIGLFSLNAQDAKIIQLNEHSKVRGVTVMEAFQQRQTIREYDSTPLSMQDLSDVLWAANGINRPNGKKTAPSAMNSQDVGIYVCLSDGAYLYDAVTNSLKQVTSQDIRSMMGRQAGTSVYLLLVSDLSNYRNYNPSNTEQNKHLAEMSCLDAGIVSQNISVCCAGLGLATWPRAGMDQSGLRTALKLKDSQIIWLNHPVGYPKK